MTVPFRVEPESSKRPAHQDPFLEFDSERPSASLFPDQDAWNQKPPDFSQLPPDRRDTPSVINPSLAFALGVAGLVTAVVGYYQMGQLLAGRAQTSASAETTRPPGVAAPTGAASATTAAPSQAPPTTGRINIASEPAGATVTVDGTARGVTPLVLANMKPGRHEVVIARGPSVVRRTVDLTAGGTSDVTAVIGERPAVPAPTTAAAPSAPTGWITFNTPIEFQVFERGRARGTSRSGRVVLGEGRHELQLVNELLEVRQTISASVLAGRGTAVQVPLPSGLLSVNAIPWADVWIDGSSVGVTPLANLSLTVGSHQVVLRHPKLGERQQSVTVKAITPTRLGVNLNK